MVSVRLPAALGVTLRVTKFAEPLPTKPTFWPPEHAEHAVIFAAPAMVPASASAVEPPPLLPPGTTRISRDSKGRRVALYLVATVPPLLPDHRSVTAPLPLNPTCDQFTETVMVPEVLVLKRATTYAPFFSFLLYT